MKYSGAAITIKLLERQGIKNIIGIPGGSNLPLYDALYESSINHILSRHEQGAAFIAQGMARSNGEVAVCFATSGPGATNLLTAIADAKLDSVPIVSITGQVPYGAIGTDAFQEVDTYGLTIPITKHNFLVRSVEELFYVIPEAFKIAREGRPGPVNIDIPKNIQLQEIEFDEWPEPYVYKNTKTATCEKLVKKAAEMINSSQKPILYIGGGIISSNASEEVYKLAVKNNIPVASTLMALGAFNPDSELYLGMLGMHGARYTNFLMNESDLILALGVRFDDRAIGNASKFCPNAKIIHIDIDESEINKIKESHLFINGDVKSTLIDITDIIEENPREDWLLRVREMKAKHPFVMPDKDDFMHPINIIKHVSSIVPKDSIIATDVGQHQMWTAQVYPFKYPRSLLTSGGLGTMGFGLPAAIGAALENKDKTVVCFSGDGSILMNIQELATLSDLGLNVKVLILNNGHLGLVRQQQEMIYNGRYIASKFLSNPDFAAISRGFGVEAYDISKEAKPLEALEEALLKPGPVLINIPVRANENVVPIVPPGAGNTEMLGGEYYDN
ncbi:biosynthetic-type acetolactate synthase large subunit [Clostridium sp. SYSU_GA19001]|uniref:biosynthetic-type acetolactate synthase large subunit n=1 Tax=Clostridium caldaquaticum TaxID=2940653 RepID=UPI0020779287|nr:biosynthetic-type acetolactate synthase large subunit [Clostridium caldaquaticum]MCM8711363.1 biosynthetic-type acetolactate synthase large subunit [Clostridium caldaquaticum]